MKAVVAEQGSAPRASSLSYQPDDLFKRRFSMLHDKERFKLRYLLRITPTVSYVIILLTLITTASRAQTPTPTPITKPDPPSVQTPSTVGRITKWAGASKNGIGIIGDSVMTESTGNIGIDVTNPSAKLTVGGTVTATGAIN